MTSQPTEFPGESRVSPRGAGSADAIPQTQEELPQFSNADSSGDSEKIR